MGEPYHGFTYGFDGALRQGGPRSLVEHMIDVSAKVSTFPPGRARVQEVLSTHYPRYIETALDAETRKRFDIKIPPEWMETGDDRWHIPRGRCKSEIASELLDDHASRIRLLEEE